MHKELKKQEDADASGSDTTTVRSTPTSEIPGEFQEASAVPSEDARTPSPTPSVSLELAVRAFEAAALENEACYQRLLEGITKAYTSDPALPKE